MPRRGKVIKREIPPDPKYQNKLVGRILGKVMMCGKRGVAEKLIYDALTIVEKQSKKPPVEVLEQAIKNITPLLEVKPRRVGGATYQVPIEVKGERGVSLAIKWLIVSTRARSGKSFAEKFAQEVLDASQSQGAAIKKREETHKMAEANRAFVHYRW